MTRLTNLTSNAERAVEIIPRGTSASSQSLFQTALQSIQELDPGTGYVSKSLYRTVLRTVAGFYYNSPNNFFATRDIKEVTREEIFPITSEIYNLLTWPNGWNGYDACAPRFEAVQYADHWIELLYQEVMNSGQEWVVPNVTANAEGEVVFEWRHGAKRLTIYIGNQSAEFVKVWGLDINTDMDDGYADSPSKRTSLWKWLMS